MNNHYEQKQEEKRQRLLERAEVARNLSNEKYEQARGVTDGIPMGQPILVGHHSEARHRADIARSDNAMRASAEADRKAEQLEQRAANMGSGGVSSDDPDAAAKLAAQLSQAETEHALMKDANAEARKLKQERPYPPYCLTNSNATIKRLRDRIETLKAQAARQGWTLAVGDIELIGNDEANRLQIKYPGKPDDDTRTELKRAGFRWAPSVGVWQRQWNRAGEFALMGLFNEAGAAIEGAA